MGKRFFQIEDDGCGIDASSPEATLVRAAKSGSARAFHHLADRYHARVYRMVFFRVRSRMDAEDITQEVFLTAYKKMPRLKSDHKFRSWLYRVALNRVKDHFRKRRLQSILGLLPGEAVPMDALAEENPGTDPVDRVMQQQFRQQLEVLLEKLPGMEKEVFLLRFFDQMRIDEISRILDKKPSTIKTHLYRAIAKMKKKRALLQTIAPERVP